MKKTRGIDTLAKQLLVPFFLRRDVALIYSETMPRSTNVLGRRLHRASSV